MKKINLNLTLTQNVANIAMYSDEHIDGLEACSNYTKVGKCLDKKDGLCDYCSSSCLKV